LAVLGIAVHGEDHVGVMRDHGLGGGFVDTGRRGGSGGAGGRRGAAGGGLVFAFAATGEGNGDGQQTGGSQRHTNHGEHPASCGWTARGAQLRHNAKDLHLCKGFANISYSLAQSHAQGNASRLRGSE
jgi:hypothetical protein